MKVSAISKFEHFFRAAASLDFDKADLKRYGDFINAIMYDLLLRGQAAAKANGRDIIAPFDLPITKGLQEAMNAFRGIDDEIDLKSALGQLIRHPPLHLACSDETDAAMPDIAGGISVAIARTFRLVDPKLKNPQTEHWERCFRIFRLLL